MPIECTYLYKIPAVKTILLSNLGRISVYGESFHVGENSGTIVFILKIDFILPLPHLKLRLIDNYSEVISWSN